MDLLAAVERLVRVILGDFRFFKEYTCTVEGQSGMELDLRPDDPEIAGPGGLQGVPLDVGLPGFVVEVPVGARVRLRFADGKPSKPRAALFEPGSVTAIRFADGTQAIARQGDLTIAGGVGLVMTLMPVPPALPAPPNGAVVCGVPHLVSFSPIPPTPVSADPLYGSIATGRPEFTA